MLLKIPATLLLLVAALGLAFGASVAQGQDKPAAAIPAFSHKEHVSEHWSTQALKGKGGRDGEYARDCRGCHDYREGVAPAQLAKPSDRCERCHDPDGYWKATAKQSIDTSRARVDPANEAKRLFKHTQHQKYEDGKALDCADCHYEDTTKASKPTWAIKIPSDNLENKSYCTKCHNNAKPVEQWTDTERQNRKSFNKGLTEEATRHASTGSPQAALVFSHAAHLGPEAIRGGNLETCKKCHTSMEKSKPDSLAETQFDIDACAQCHNGMSFEASGKRENGEPFKVQSPTQGVFSHAQHLGQASGKAGIKPVGPEGCLHCHEFEASATRDTGVRSFALKSFLAPGNGKGAFGGCIQCHTSLNIPDHGNVDACAQCHNVEPGSLTTRSAMEANRPRDPIRRVDPASFTFERQSHKFISAGLTKDAPSACSDCHKAKLEAQPSRINEKPFSHATHLPPGFTPSQAQESDAVCTKCHTTIAQSVSLKDVAQHYDSSACVECHGKTEPTPIPEKNPVTELFRFDHKQHVGKKSQAGKPTACGDCHLVTAADKQSKIVLADKIAECTLCHGHPDKPDGRINHFAKAAVDSCAQCHAAGVPSKGQVVSVGRARLVAEGRGSQEHKGEAQCTACHQIVEQAFDTNSAQRVTQLPISITVLNSPALTPTPHKGRIKAKNEAASAAEKEALKKYFWDEASCIDCHWATTRLITASDVQDAQKSSTALPRVTKLLRDPSWREHYRQIEGNELSGFPGLDPARKR